MNQMMGASATALSEFLGRPINISTPEAMVVGPDNDYAKAVQVQEGEEIVSVSFRLTIDGVMDSNFASILGIQLAKEIVDQVMGQQETVEAPAQPAPAAQPAAAPGSCPVRCCRSGSAARRSRCSAEACRTGSARGPAAGRYAPADACRLSALSGLSQSAALSGLSLLWRLSVLSGLSQSAHALWRSRG